MAVDLPAPDLLARILETLFKRGEMPLDQVGLDAVSLREMGFGVSQGIVFIPADTERLDEDTIQGALSAKARAWIVDMAAHQIVGSTNTILNELAGHQSINGVVRLAELQVQGRGRRGRVWISPYANNLAMSIGVRIARPPVALGGFSLCVGLSVADGLQQLGVQGVELKWPNDVLIDGRKVAGILIELHGAGTDTEVVIGIGVNFRLSAETRAAIEQPVTDLRSTGRTVSRNELAGTLISSLVEFVDGYAELGFEPMRQAFDSIHRFHDQPCVLLLGSDNVAGVVRGVTSGGELLLEVDGRLQTFGAGEVSLRLQDG